MGVCAAGKTEWEGRVGIVVGNIIKRLCTAAWTLTAIAAVAWYTQQGIDLSTIDPDFVYGNVAQAFLPQMMPGLLGVFLAALLAGVMSSCDSFMISSSGLFTENIYKRWFPDRSQVHYVWVGRGIAILVVAGGVAFAFWVPSVVKALEIWFMIAPMMGLVFWIGLVWRRMTVAGAWATTLTGFAVWWLTTQSWFIDWAAGLSQANYLRLIWMERGEPTIYVPWQILAYMTVASLAGILVSLLTKPVAKSKLDRFYELTRTPVQPGEEMDRTCVLPPGITPGARQMITTAFGLEIPMPSRASVIGFVAAWGAVALLIGGFVAFVWW
jgi:Na+/proline symporter